MGDRQKDYSDFNIDTEMLLLIGEEPTEAVEHLESKKAIDINPVHVKALLNLRQSAVASS